MTLFAGDLFEAIPFGDQPTTLYRTEDGKHFVGEVAFAYGLLTTPTCDMAEQRDEDRRPIPSACSSLCFRWPPSPSRPAASQTA